MRFLKTIWLLVIEEFTVQVDEDIEKGEVVYNDGNGILAAAAGAKGPFIVALDAHDYSAETSHGVRCVVAQKKLGNAVKQGQYVEVSSTDGELDVWDYATPGDWFDVGGEAAGDAADTDIEAAVWVGKR